MIRKKPKVVLPTKDYPLISPGDEGKELEPGLPSSDKSELASALRSIRQEIFNEEPAEEKALAYSLTIDGTINFNSEEVMDVKMSMSSDISSTLTSSTTLFMPKSTACNVEIVINTSQGNLQFIQDLFQGGMIDKKHHYTIRVFQKGILTKTIQLYDAMLTGYTLQLDEYGANAIITINPSRWLM